MRLLFLQRIVTFDSFQSVLRVEGLFAVLLVIPTLLCVGTLALPPKRMSRVVKERVKKRVKECELGGESDGLTPSC